MPAWVCLAKASCASAIRTARNLLSDVGEKALAKSPGLSKLAKRSEKNSERDCQRIMVSQFGLGLPIPKSRIRVHDKYSLPILSLRDWASFLVRENHWHMLCGLHRPDWEREERILEMFWSLYEVQYPQHPVFEKARQGELCLARCAPCVVHGDEGRGRKRSAFLVVSVHSLLGKGIAGQRKSRSKKPPYLKMWCNYEGHTYTSRFLLAAVGKDLYTKSNSRVFEDLMEFAATDCSNLLNHPIRHPVRGNFHIAVLNVVGDWPWLCKAGQLERSFANVQKHKEKSTNSKPSKGVCHLCSAGKAQWDWEEIGSRNPKWLESVFAEDPFKSPRTPWCALPHQMGESPSLFFFDLFHCCHLGVGKYILGTILVLLAQRRPEGNTEERFEGLTADYLAWCKRNRRRPYLSKITATLLNWPTTASFPNASWHKGDLTNTMCHYVEHRFKHEDWSDNNLLALGGEAVCALNDCLRILYKGELWLQPAVAREASEYGLRFLRRYGAGARIAQQNKQSLYVLQPKLHAWHHLMLFLLHQSQKGRTLNILAFGTQPSEDFIGRPSRLSRRVTASEKCSDRVIDRYLRSCHHEWVKAGMIINTT